MNMTMRLVLAERLKRKHPALYSIPMDISVKEAAAIMTEKGIGAVLVKDTNDDDGNFVGICTERDILKTCAKNDNLSAVKVSEVMCRDMVTCDINEAVQFVIRKMYQKHIRHIPLAENGKIIALISIRDLMYCVDMEREITMSHLNDMSGATRFNRIF